MKWASQYILATIVDIVLHLIIRVLPASQKVHSNDFAVCGLILLPEFVKSISGENQFWDEFRLNLFHMSLINTLHRLQHLCRDLPSLRSSAIASALHLK